MRARDMRTKPTDSFYYQRRLDQERARAAQSSDPVARRIHHELADRYAVLAEPA